MVPHRALSDWSVVHSQALAQPLSQSSLTALSLSLLSQSPLSQSLPSLSLWCSWLGVVVLTCPVSRCPRVVCPSAARYIAGGSVRTAAGGPQACRQRPEPSFGRLAGAAAVAVAVGAVAAARDRVGVYLRAHAAIRARATVQREHVVVCRLQPIVADRYSGNDPMKPSREFAVTTPHDPLFEHLAEQHGTISALLCRVQYAAVERRSVCSVRCRVVILSSSRVHCISGLPRLLLHEHVLHRTERPAESQRHPAHDKWCDLRRRHLSRQRPASGQVVCARCECLGV
jgi:hypothetical protein